jgi:hypothetical protein
MSIKSLQTRVRRAEDAITPYGLLAEWRRYLAAMKPVYEQLREEHPDLEPWDDAEDEPFAREMASKGIGPGEHFASVIREAHLTDPNGCPYYGHCANSPQRTAK